jgi:uncharacterized phiE125 gp8 family phage protein
MKVSKTSGPTMYPLRLDEIKAHLRIPEGETNEDDLLNGLQDAAVEYVENHTNRKLLTQTWKVYFDDWPDGDSFEIPYPPLQSIASTGVVYTNSTNDSTTYGSTKWATDAVSVPGRLVREYEESAWPTTATLHNNNPIEISFTCGYTTASNIPQSIKSAMLLIIGDLYENREQSVVGPGWQVSRVSVAAQSLLAPYRNFKF